MLEHIRSSKRPIQLLSSSHRQKKNRERRQNSAVKSAAIMKQFVLAYNGTELHRN